MFGFGLKNRTAEALRRAIQASLTTAYLHPAEIEKFGLNDDASAWLMTESFAHHLFALGLIYTKYCQQKWATVEFFKGAILEGIAEIQEPRVRHQMLSLAPILFKRCDIFNSMSGEDKVANKHFIDSSRLVVKQDENANLYEVTNVLELSTKKYTLDVGHMFSN